MGRLYIECGIWEEFRHWFIVEFYGGRSKAVRRSMHDLWSGILREKRGGDDLDRFADLVSLVALVRLVELEGRKDGGGPCRKSEGFSQSKVKGQKKRTP